MLDPELIESLTRLLGQANVSTLERDLDRYSADALAPSRAYKSPEAFQKIADVVVFPRSVQQVVDVVRMASTHKIPIVPYGGGTGVMGAALPVQGGIVIDLKGLNKVLDVDPIDMTALVEAGVILEDLVTILESHGMMPGHDPWSVPIATVGGAISTNGVGYRAASYGPMGDQVLGLEVVLPDGRILNTRSVPKYSAGPNLNHLFIGSEGAFGIITKATLKVFRLPEDRSFATVGFDSFDRGFEAVAEMFALGLRPTLVDLTEDIGPNDETSVHLYLMYEGYKEGVAAQKSRSLQVCTSFGGNDLGEAETLEYWKTRHESGDRYRTEMLNEPRSVRWQNRGRGFDYLHTAIPISRVLEYRRRCHEIFSQHGMKVIEYAIWTEPELFSMLVVPDGTVGPNSPHHRGEVVDEVLSLAQDMGGTMEYCHGVGVKLAHLLPREVGVGYTVSKVIKQAIDPHNIMNPGKLY